MPDAVQLTREGYERLEQSLEKERQRLEETITSLANTVDDAMDLENRSLNAAQIGQERIAIEARILELEDVLARAVIVEEEDLPRGQVAVGSVVMLEDDKHGRQLQVQLVSAVEISAMTEGVTQVSDDSPVGKALMGRREGETFDVELEAGRVQYTVRSVTAP
ncbi:GreA/GreB family elongation factor [Deinococcus deserti]|uniref:Putative transcription elongation factor n=1 Tax=Deinococcus deserti (strain DSM 17065 / CIP 109153 / LMG 22923 / VCD115) TaxID=546414 RepID=C1CW74_DEIDV|nr:GreA/GreB family elongation factor [Deinococcus deserti]ACO46441.1 putative transcription elongation factor [Deinococcus deserti VCD115]